MPHATQTITVEPLATPKGSSFKFGATVSGVDIENLTGKTNARRSMTCDMMTVNKGEYP
jgi:hypothetical protein